MRIFQMKSDGLDEIHEEYGGKKLFNYEKLLQKLIENNLNQLFPNLEFVKSEYPIKRFRIDTVAYDTREKSFVIIEYKNMKNKTISDQGLTYLNILKNNKSDFVLMYSLTKKKILDPDMINWNKTRLIFIAPNFTKYQLSSSIQLNLPIDLYQIQKYENKIITLNKIEDGTSNSHKHNNINSNKNNRYLKKSTTNSSSIEYSESRYLNGEYDGPKIPEITQKLYFSLRNLILDKFGQSVECKPTKRYIGFYLKHNGSAICTMAITKKQLKLAYSTKKPNLLPKIDFIVDMSNKGYWGLGNYISLIRDENDILKAMQYIEIVYKNNYSKKKKL